ncbi:MAG TPA: glycosyltransferase [Syntrophales bacterium]|nr:glycosyltransferase [Syntrophales bacterium]
MPVRNAAGFVVDAVNSVISQSLPKFELLVLDDASDDDTAARVEGIRDDRVRVIRHDEPQGIASLLNEGIESASCDLVARMDGDDRMLKKRLSVQYKRMMEDTSLAAVGTAGRYFGREFMVRVSPPIGVDCVRAFTVFDNPLLHPTVMFRKSILRKHGLSYRSEFSKSEDFDLWERLVQVAPVDNIDVVTMHLRVHSASVTGSSGSLMEEQTRSILSKGLARLGIETDPEQLDFHRRVGHGCRMKTRNELVRAMEWIDSLAEANSRFSNYPERGFREAVDVVRFRICRNSAASLGMDAWRIWKKDRCSDYKVRAEDIAWLLAGIMRHILTGQRANAD